MNVSDSRHHDDQDDQECPQQCFPSSRMFLMQLNCSDARDHDDHQKDQDDQDGPQECPPSMGIRDVLNWEFSIN